MKKNSTNLFLTDAYNIADFAEKYRPRLRFSWERHVWYDFGVDRRRYKLVPTEYVKNLILEYLCDLTEKAINDGDRKLLEWAHLHVMAAAQPFISGAFFV